MGKDTPSCFSAQKEAEALHAWNFWRSFEETLERRLAELLDGEELTLK
jgi:hypothetical protein